MVKLLFSVMCNKLNCFHNLSAAGCLYYYDRYAFG